MLIIPPVVYRKRRRPRGRAGPAIGLTLIAGRYLEQEWVRLTFDRAIEIAAMDVTQIVVLDGVTNERRWIGSGEATLIDATTVQVPLVVDGVYTGTAGALLDATADTGIVAVHQGGPWQGVLGFVLEWGE